MRSPTTRSAAVWNEIEQLHAAGISHGNLDASRILVDDTTNIALDDFTSADASGEEYWYKRDVAAVLVDTAQLVGNDRAVAAAVKALGKDRVGEVIPFVQPAALPPGTVEGKKHLGKTLKELRADLVTATGVEDAPPLKIKRLTLVNIGMLAGILLALVIAFHSIEGINWESVKGEFENADWGWAVLAAVMYPLVPMSWATALHGVREQGPSVRPDRAHAARVHLLEPDHAERHRRDRAATRLPAQAGRARSPRAAARWCSAPASAARSR